MQKILLETKDLSKHFGAVKAVDRRLLFSCHRVEYTRFWEKMVVESPRHLKCLPVSIFPLEVRSYAMVAR